MPVTSSLRSTCRCDERARGGRGAVFTLILPRRARSLLASLSAALVRRFSLSINSLLALAGKQGIERSFELCAYMCEGGGRGAV